MMTRKTAQAAVKVFPEMLAHLNTQIATLGSRYFFSSNERGTLTYFRRYDGINAGYSVPRGEIEAHLRCNYSVTLATMIDAAVDATCPAVDA